MMPVTAEVAGRHDSFESNHLSFISAFHSRARRMGGVDKRATKHLPSGNHIRGLRTGGGEATGCLHWRKEEPRTELVTD